MRKSKTLEEIIHVFIQALLLISFALYWAYFSRTNKITEFIVFVAPMIILISLTIIIVKRDREIIRERRIRSEVDQQITISAYDELKHDLAAFFAAIIILIIAKVFSAKVDIADILQASIALIFIYLVKSIYFGRIR